MVAPAPIAPELKVRIRGVTESDVPYIDSTFQATWLLSNRNRRLSRGEFGARYSHVVTDGLFKLPDTRIIVACDEEDPDLILGWLCYTPGTPTIHYAFTRGGNPNVTMRRQGIMVAMLAVAGVRDGSSFAYTFHPQDRSHRQNNERTHLEAKLLAAASRRRIVARYVSIESFLGRGRR